MDTFHLFLKLLTTLAYKEEDILTKLAAFVLDKGVEMFLSHEKYKEIGVKMIWHWLDILHPRESYTDQYTH